jgi:hypothetical protein
MRILFLAWLAACLLYPVPAFALAMEAPPYYEPTAVGTATQAPSGNTDTGLTAEGNPGTSRGLGDVNQTPIVEGGAPNGSGAVSGSNARGLEINSRGSWAPGGPWGSGSTMSWAMMLKFKTGALESYVNASPAYFADVWDRLKTKFPFNLLSSLSTMVQSKSGAGAGLELAWEIPYAPDQTMEIEIPAAVVTAIGWGRSIALWIFWLAAGWFLLKNFVGWFA